MFVSTTSTSVFVCLWSLSSVVSGIGFYLHVNRTGPQRMSTHHIADPTQKKNFIFLSFSGSFFPSSSHCFCSHFYLCNSCRLHCGFSASWERNHLRVMRCKSALTLNTHAGEKWQCHVNTKGNKASALLSHIPNHLKPEHEQPCAAADSL